MCRLHHYPVIHLLRLVCSYIYCVFLTREERKHKDGFPFVLDQQYEEILLTFHRSFDVEEIV